MYERVCCVCMDVWGVCVCVLIGVTGCAWVWGRYVCVYVYACVSVCAWHPHPTCLPTTKPGCSRQQRGCHEMH